MGQIKDYKILNELTNDATFVVETIDGTRRVPYSMLDDKMNDKVNNGGIGEAKNIANNALTVAQSAVDVSEQTLEIVDNINQKNIKTAYISKGHLYIVLSDEQQTTIDAGIVNDGFAQYGVCRDVDSHSPTLTRVGAAIGLEANIGIGSAKVKNDFDDIYPWSEMRKCTVAVDGTVTSYEGDASYKEDGSIGQVMVEIPKFYIKQFVDEISHKEYTYICKEQLSGYRLPQAFYNKDGDELDTIYIGAYIGTENENGDLESVSGLRKYYAINKSLNTCREMATKSRNNNWHLFDAMEYIDVVVPLFIIEFATLDSRSIMQGYTDIKNSSFSVYEDYENAEKSNILITYDYDNLDDFPFVVGTEIIIPYYLNEGESVENIDETDDTTYHTGASCDVYGIRKITQLELLHDDETDVNYVAVHFSGSPLFVETDVKIYANYDRCGITNEIVSSSGIVKMKAENSSAFVYRGLENLYGTNWYNVIDGIYITKDSYYVCNDIVKYAETVTADYKKLSYAKIQKGGYIRQMGYDESLPWARFPVDVDGTSEQDFCDYINANGRSGTENSPCAYRLGRSSFSFGLFAAITNNTASAAYLDVSRLTYSK